VALVVFFPVLLVLGLCVAVVTVAAWLWALWRKATAVRQFQAAWQCQGKDLLLVYSNSPHWKTYIETEWLPRWGSRAVVLNWSERQRWRAEHPHEAQMFSAFAGSREFNPLAIVVRGGGWRDVRIVRFWRAFRDYKHGKDATLRRAEATLEQILASRGNNSPLTAANPRFSEAGL
jgi:hypothetical protein